MIRTVLRKELSWSRHRVGSLLLVLVLLPAAFAGGATFFQHVLPKDAPVAVVGGEETSDGDQEVVRASLDLFSKPVDYDARDRALRALERETVYAVVDVPPGIADPDVEEVTVRVTIDSDVVPYREPSAALVGVVRSSLDENLDKRVVVEKTSLDPERKLSAYLLPTFLLILATVFAFAYLPYNLAEEAEVLDRLRVETSLGAVVGGKLLFLAGLLFVPLIVFRGVAAYVGYDVTLLAPGVIVAYMSTFLACGAVAAGVTFLTRFSTTGRLLNVLLLFGTMGFSGLVYPAGFFSPVRRWIIRRFPIHYAVVLARGAALKDHSLTDYATWVAGLVGLVLVGGLLLAGSVRWYDRRD